MKTLMALVIMMASFSAHAICDKAKQNSSLLSAKTAFEKPVTSDAVKAGVSKKGKI